MDVHNLSPRLLDAICLPIVVTLRRMEMKIEKEDAKKDYNTQIWDI